MKYLLRLSYTLLLFLAFTTKGWAEGTTRPVMGAERMELLLPLLEGKRVALRFSLLPKNFLVEI